LDITCAEALSNAARNLTNAETVTDLTLIERLTTLAAPGSISPRCSRSGRRSR
jgi:hypothetical protein